jgi:hypothetical protein
MEIIQVIKGYTGLAEQNKIENKNNKNGKG